MTTLDVQSTLTKKVEVKAGMGYTATSFYKSKYPGGRFTAHQTVTIATLMKDSKAQLIRTERSSLPQSHHSRVDATLKDLKLLSKRLHSALSSYESELKVLERIYYKSKNQHRSALFWRRITETRRYGRRIQQINLRLFVDGLRMSFFREDR